MLHAAPAPKTTLASGGGAVAERLARLCARAAQAAKDLDFDDAGELYESCLVLAEAVGERAAAAEARAGLAYVAHVRGDLDAATALYTRCADAADDPDLERRLLARCRLGFLHYDRGDLESAEAHLREGLDGAPGPALRGRALGWLGNVARARGEHAHAASLYEAATRTLRAAGDAAFAVTFDMDRAIAALLAGETAAAANDLDGLRASDEAAASPRVGALVGHYGALARLVLGVPGDDDHAAGRALPIAPFLARARETARAPSDDALDELRDALPPDAHARITLDLVERLHRRRALPPARGLVVSRAGSFFRLGAGELVTLGQRAPLARLLTALVDGRTTAPGRYLDGEELVAYAWPGERLSPPSRKNRLHVAIATLRKLGLRPVLQADGSRYRLAPDASLVTVGAPTSSAQRSR